MELPVFPLNTVLFPGMPLDLQIFEDRYLAMFRYLQEKNDARFAVHLIRKGIEAGGALPIPAATGCIAAVEYIQSIPGSERIRLKLRAIGTERVKIKNLSVNEGGFYVAEMETLQYLPFDAQEKTRLEQELLLNLEDFLSLPTVKNFKPNLQLLASHGYTLAYAMAGMFGISEHMKQKFLEENSVPEIYQMAIRILRGEVRLIRQTYAIRSAKKMGPYSIN